MHPILIPNTRILLIGEFPSDQEIYKKVSFVGQVWEELDQMLLDAGLSRGDVSLTNVFFERPLNGDLNNWAVPRKDIKNLLSPSLPFSYIPCKKGVVSPEKVQPALRRLQQEIGVVNPNVIVTLGNTALSALCEVSGITKLRGALHFYEAYKVIPTYHPAAVLRNYEWRPSVVADLQKAKIHAKSKEANLLNRRISIATSIADLIEIEKICNEAEYLAFDIETKMKQITCIGFAPNKLESFVIPFWTKEGSFWKEEEEIFAYKVMKSICKNTAIKIAQNGLYDIQYLYYYGVATNNFLEDTMIKHHSLYPALPKGLDYLGSIYADERAWKRWRIRGGDQIKREE